jgi:hypothetical protein
VGGETAKIGEIANKLSTEVFKWFRWDRVPLVDQNFDCLKQAKHAPKKTSKHTHPVDVTFSYIDPYLGTRVIFNVDLKSYKKESIDPVRVKASLKSLAQTIECARISDEWQGRYNLNHGPFEVRGLLFVYNHDGEYDKNFQEVFKGKRYKTASEEKERNVNFDTIPVESGMVLHIIEPKLISFMTTVLADVNYLIAQGSFPRTNYQFFYPDLKLHKTRGDEYRQPCTIEMISGPFFIVEHDSIKTYVEETGKSEVTFQNGYVIFYNRAGDSPEEFMYFIDTLSNYQILNRNQKIRVRVMHELPAKDIRSNFKKAIEMYISEWGFDEHKRERLESIDLHIVEIVKTKFSSIELGWE